MAADGKRYAVLVVEDEALIGDVIRDSLEQTPFEVIGVSSSADDAATLARALEPEFALIDVKLGGERDGLSLAAELTAELGIHCIIMTGSDDPFTLERVGALGAGLLRKPFRMERLRIALTRAAEQKTR